MDQIVKIKNDEEKQLHPLLEHFSIFSHHLILGDDNIALKFIYDMGLIPSTNTILKCPKCSNVLKSTKDKSRVQGWRYLCTNRKTNGCNGTLSATRNTFFENSKLPYQDVLAIIFAFVSQHPITAFTVQLNSWRKRRKMLSVSFSTVLLYFQLCQDVVEIVSSHFCGQLGGRGKIIRLQDAFLTRRKFATSKYVESKSKLVLGIFCRTDKEGLYYTVHSRSKNELWPLIKQCCHPETQFKHYRESHLDESSDCDYEETNGKEEEEKRKKESEQERACAKMALLRYRRTRLANMTLGEKIAQFIEDIVRVFPGPQKNGLQLKELADMSNDLGEPDIKKSYLEPEIILCDTEEDIDFINNVGAYTDFE